MSRNARVVPPPRLCKKQTQPWYFIVDPRLFAQRPEINHDDASASRAAVIEHHPSMRYRETKESLRQKTEHAGYFLKTTVSNVGAGASVSVIC